MDEEFENDNESVVSETDSEVEQETKQNDIKKKVVFNEDDDDYVESENGDGENDDDDDDLDLESENSDIGEEADVIVDTNRPFNEFDNFSDDDDDDENDEDENYLQKFDVNSRQKIISEFHPELQAHNSDEIEMLSRIVRDENGKIIDPLHKTLPFITKYEKARIIGERAKQIDAGAEPLIEVEPTLIDGYLIALKEYEEKAIPFIIQRPLPSGGCEYWKFSDLEIL